MAIEINQLTVTIDNLEILKEIDLIVEKNSFVSIIAPSGAGKSTLLKVLTGVISPTSGEIFVDGEPIMGLNTAFSYMPQEDLLLPWASVFQNVTLYQKINHQKIDQEKVMEELQLFGLEKYSGFLPEQLSGGMKQRVALLRTMMNPADYLLLDEPFGALDAMTRSQMQDWLLQLPKQKTRTTLLVTHDIEEAIYLSNRIIVLSARPARIIADIKLPEKHRTRSWLGEQATLKQNIYQLLEGETHVD
ncbi:ABC transporter ATP-binding protein [Enterococcus thailandicus]|uniref:ABC transporter ATP-binding protein n=1 Tax=Enterococcus TaxID=1350 RepID=UPI00094CB386|nr:ABC transporter ATP-binding protein [Enterococcus thailandicus]ASZ07232.1 ABC transporter ATP-binding protein [Enterococcus thailandicus]MDK4351398.1 ABC transporter ATP-binding protein [Enterococcus thailandicus]MDT2732869.1 ABC transporter ATP-binding protein [Enterococcus thailandicus]GMC03925.1 ABC transporter ATP-binding protein [Enterococcus thailandicus]GMC10485.1 ABC transporter ATP-binding protein [Enterococcus thailandicus]